MNLRDFRSRYPQYDEVSDTELASALYNKFYSDALSFDQFSSLIELNGPPVAAGTENLDPRDYQAQTPAIEGSAIQSLNNPPSGRPWADFTWRQNFEDQGKTPATGSWFAPETTGAAFETGLKGSSVEAANTAAIVGQVGVFKTLDREMKAMDAVDAGEDIRKYLGGPADLPYARSYQGSDPQQREMVRKHAIDRAAENEEALKASLQLFVQYQKEAAARRGTIPELKDLVNDPEARKRWDDWLKWNIGQGLGSTAPFIAAGATGALLRGLTGPAAASLMAQTAGSALAYGAGFGELGGELIGEAIKDGVVDQATIDRVKQKVVEGGAGVVLGAAPHAAIELYLGATYHVMKAFTGKPVKEVVGDLAKIVSSKEALKYFLKQTGLGSLGEGNEEVLQQGLGDVLKLMRGAPPEQIFSKDNAWNYAEAWTAGATGAVGMTGVSSASTAVRARAANQEVIGLQDRARRVQEAIESQAAEAARAQSPVEAAGITPVEGASPAARVNAPAVPGILPSPVAMPTDAELTAPLSPVAESGVTPVVGAPAAEPPATEQATAPIAPATEPATAPIDRPGVERTVSNMFGHNARYLTILTNPADPAFVESGRLGEGQFSRDDEGLTIGDRAYVFLDNVQPQYTPGGKMIMDRTQRAIWVAAHELEHVAQNKLSATGTGLGAVVTSPQWRGYTKALRAMHQNANFQQIVDMMPIARGPMQPLVASMEAAAEVGAAVTTGRFDELADRYRVTIDNSQTKELTGLWKRLALNARIFLSSIGVRKLSDPDLIQIMHMQRKALESDVAVGQVPMSSKSRYQERTIKGQKQIVGAKGMSKRAIERAARNMGRLAEEGIESKDWYIDSARAIFEASGNDLISAERLTQLLSITSSGASVKSNFTLFEKLVGQYLRGEPLTGAKPEVLNKARDLLYFGRDWEGKKTNDFYRNIIDRMIGLVPDYPVIDRHQFELMFGKGVKSGGPKQYELAQDVLRRVAEERGLDPDQAQAAMWVGKKTEEKLAEMKAKVRSAKGSKYRGWSDQQMRAEAYRQAKTSYADEIAARGTKLQPGLFDVLNEVFQKVEPELRNITAEVVPSQKTKLGQRLLGLPPADRKSWQGRMLERVFGTKMGEIDFGSFMKAFGVTGQNWRADYGSGAYIGRIGPNIVLQVKTDSETARRMAKAWQAIFHQDAVPFFRADPKLVDDATVPRGAWIKLDRKLTPAEEKRFYDTLQAEAKTDFTRMGDREYAIINFRGNDGQPFSGLTDQQFGDAIDRVIPTIQAGVEASHDFGAETFYEEQDVQDRSQQMALLDAAAGGSPALLGRLRRWATAFEKAAGQSLQRPAVLRSTPRPAEPAVRPGREGGVDAVGIHFGRQAELTELSGSYFGSGIRGEEQERISYAKDPRIKRRVYFYVTQPGAFDVKRREAGLGPYAYRAELGNLYEPDVSPLISRTPVYSNEEFKIVDQGETSNRWESAVLDAGYDGYLIRNPDIAVVLNRDVPVEFLGTLGQQPPIQFSRARAEPSKPQGRADIIDRISPELLKQIQVDAQVFIESENRYVMEKVSAKEALDAIEEDLEAYRALLDCVRG